MGLPALNVGTGRVPAAAKIPEPCGLWPLYPIISRQEAPGLHVAAVTSAVLGCWEPLSCAAMILQGDTRVGATSEWNLARLPITECEEISTVSSQ